MAKTLNKKSWADETYKQITSGTYNSHDKDWVDNTYNAITSGTYSTKNNKSFTYTQEEVYDRNMLNQARINIGNIEATDQYKDAYNRYKNMSTEQFAKANTDRRQRAQDENYEMSLDDAVMKMMYDDPYHRASTGTKVAASTQSILSNISKGVFNPLASASQFVADKTNTAFADDINTLMQTLNNMANDTEAIDKYKYRTQLQNVLDSTAQSIGGSATLMGAGMLGGTAIGAIAPSLGVTGTALSNLIKIGSGAGMFSSMLPQTYYEELDKSNDPQKSLLIAMAKSGVGTGIESIGGFDISTGKMEGSLLAGIIEEASEEGIEAIYDGVIDGLAYGELQTMDDVSNLFVDALQNAAMSIPTTLIMGAGNTVQSTVTKNKVINNISKETGIKKSDIKKQLNQYAQNKVQSEEIKQASKETAEKIDTEYGTIDTETEAATQQEVLDKVKKQEEKTKKQQETRKKNKEAKEAEARAKEELNKKLEKNDTDPTGVLNLKDKISNLINRIDTEEDTDVKEALTEKRDKLLEELDTSLRQQDTQVKALDLLKEAGIDTSKLGEIEKILGKQQEVQNRVEQVEEKATTEEQKVEEVKQEEPVKPTEYNYDIGEIKKRNGKYTSQIFDENGKYLGTVEAKSMSDIGKVLMDVKENGVVPESSFTADDKVKYDAIEEEQRIKEEKAAEKKRHYQEAAKKRKEAQEAKREETRALNNKGVKTTNVDTTELMNKKAETFDRDLSKIDPARRQEYKQGTIDLYNKYIADGGKEIEKFEQLKNELENDKAIDKAVEKAKAQEIIDAKEARVKGEENAKKLAKKKERTKPRLRDLEYNAKNEYDLFVMSGKEVHKNNALGWYKQYKDNGGKNAIDNLEQMIHPLSEKQEQATEQAVKEIEKETKTKIEPKQASAKDLFMQQLKQQMDIANMTPAEKARLQARQEKNLLDAVTKGVEVKEDKKTLNKMKKDTAIKEELKSVEEADTKLATDEFAEDVSLENQYKLMKKLDINQKVEYNTHDNVMPDYINKKYSKNMNIVNDTLNNINALGLNNKNGEYNDIIDRVIHDRITFGIDIKFSNSAGIAANSEESNVAASKLAKKNIGGVYIRRGETGNETRRILLNTQLGKVDMMHELLAHELSHHLQNFGSKTELDEAMLNWRRAKIGDEAVAKEMADIKKRYKEGNDYTVYNELMAEWMAEFQKDNRVMYDTAIGQPKIFDKIRLEVQKIWLSTVGKNNTVATTSYEVYNRMKKVVNDARNNAQHEITSNQQEYTNADTNATATYDKLSKLYDKFIEPTQPKIPKDFYSDFDQMMQYDAEETQEEEVKQTVKYKDNKIDNIIVDWQNKLHPLEKLDKIMSWTTGKETHAIMEAYTANETSYAQGQHIINNYQMNNKGEYIGKSVDTIEAPLEALSDDKYAIADRYRTLQSSLQRRLNSKYSYYNDNIYPEYSTKQIQALITDLQTRYNSITTLVDSVNAEFQIFRHNEVLNQIDAGRLSKVHKVSEECAREMMGLSDDYITKHQLDDGDVMVDNAEYLTKLNSWYVPTEKYGWQPKDTDLKDTTHGQLGTPRVKGITDTNGEYKMYSSKIAIRQWVMDNQRALRQQQLYSAIGNALESNSVQIQDKKDLKKLHDEGMVKKDDGTAVISYYTTELKEDGSLKPTRQVIPSSIYNALAPYSNKITNYLNDENDKTAQAISKVLKTNSQLLREAYTGINSVYSVKNKIMDSQDYWYSSQDNALDIVKNTNAFIIDMKNNDPIYHQFVAMGLMNQFKGYDTKTKEILNKETNKFKRALNNLEQFNAMTEASTRYIAFKIEYLRSGDINKAARAAKEATTNFGKCGLIPSSMDRMGFTMYLGSSQAGLNRAIEVNIGRIVDGVKASVNGIKNGKLTEFEKTCVVNMAKQVGKMGAAGLTHVLLRKLLKDLDDDNTYDLLPSYIKDNSYIIPVGSGNYISIPKGRMLSIPYALSDIIYSKDISDVDKKSILETAEYIWERTGVNDLQSSFALSTWVQVATNKTHYGYQIVDDDASTSEKFKTRAKYVMDNYGGLLADIVDMGIDYKNGKQVKIPVVSTYYGSTSNNSIAQARYWEYINKYKESSNLIDKLTYQSLYYDYTQQIAPLKKQLEVYEKDGDMDSVRKMKQQIANLYSYLVSNAEDDKIDMNGDGSLISYRGYLYELTTDDYGNQKYKKKSTK